MSNASSMFTNEMRSLSELDLTSRWSSFTFLGISVWLLIKIIFSVVVLTVVFSTFSITVSVFFIFALVLIVFFDVFSRLFLFFLRYADIVTYSEALRRADIMNVPIIEKETFSGENSLLQYACSSMQGWRRTMEDAHTVLLNPNVAFFAVFDGHGGDTTAKYCAGNLHKSILSSEAFYAKDVTRAMHDGFVNTDKEFYQMNPGTRSGCAAVTLCICDDILYCANAGDSRCVLCRNGVAYPLSNDHKPVNTWEQLRIERAGSYVFNRRVNGILALSRGLGDFTFKANTVIPWEQQAVTSVPEIQSTPLQPESDGFVVLACDGIWDVMTNEQVVLFVKRRINMEISLATIAEELMTHCLSTTPFRKGNDNMSVIIVQFKSPKKQMNVSVASESCVPDM